MSRRQRRGEWSGVPVNESKAEELPHFAGLDKRTKISQIYKTLQDGIVRNGMASFSYLPPADRFALIHYVRSFTAGHPVDAPQDLQGLEAAYQLSRGSDTPGQIPVKKAEEIIVHEGDLSVAHVKALAATISRAPESAGEALFTRLANDKQKVLTALVQNGSSLGSLNQFMKVVSADPIQIGLRPEVVQLNAAQWSALYQFVSALRERKG